MLEETKILLCFYPVLFVSKIDAVFRAKNNNEVALSPQIVHFFPPKSTQEKYFFIIKTNKKQINIS